MDEMRAVELAAWGGELSVVDDRPVPPVGPAEVRIEVEAASVGLSVYNAIQGFIGDRPDTLPVVPGHEIVGTVAECGPGVTNVEPGDRVGTYFYLSCGHCPPCQSGAQNRCANHGGYIGVDVDGGYAETVVLPAGNAIPLPAGLDPVDATVVPDAVGTPYHIASERARIERGDEVLVLGAGGGVGIHMLQVARSFGARVTAVDRTAPKLEACRSVGAAATVDTDETSLEDGLDPRASFDAVIDFTGAMPLVEAAAARLAPRGRLVHLTAFPDNHQSVNPQALVSGERAVLGSRYCTKAEFREAAALVAEGHVEPVITEVVDLDGVEDLLAAIRDGEVVGRGAVVP